MPYSRIQSASVHLIWKKKSLLNWKQNRTSTAKGQLISEWFFGVFKSSKKWTFSLTDFSLASKMGQIKKITDILSSSRAEICQKKVHFLEDLKTPKFHSEINWPLDKVTQSLKYLHNIKLYGRYVSTNVKNIFEVFTTHSFTISRKKDNNAFSSLKAEVYFSSGMSEFPAEK